MKVVHEIWCVKGTEIKEDSGNLFDLWLGNVRWKMVHILSVPYSGLNFLRFSDFVCCFIS